MKKVFTAAVAGVTTLALAVPAVAQTPPLDINVTGKVTAAKGATKKKPKNAKVRLGFTANVEAKKTASELRLFYPEFIKLSGKGFPTCSVDVVAVDPSQCPKGSKIGQGTATASLNGASTLNFATQVFVNGPNKVSLYLKETGDIGLQVAFDGTISKATKPYGNQVVVEIPETVQKPAGLESYITSVDTTIGAKFTKGKGKKKKTYFAASLTGCPKDKTHDYGVSLQTVANTAGPGGATSVYNGESPCKK